MSSTSCDKNALFDNSSNREERCSKLRDLEPTGPPDRTYKVVFAGDAAVGKTSFINRITKGVFMSNLSSTLGVDFQVKTIRVDDRNIAIQLWDTAGQADHDEKCQLNQSQIPCQSQLNDLLTPSHHVCTGALPVRD